MRFLRLALEGYGRFRERTVFEFDAGLNCVLGANESGKSTLLSALLDALYTLPSTTAQPARERIHWGHPHGWRLELELELRGERVLLCKFHPVDDPRRRAEFSLQIAHEILSGDAARARWDVLWQVPQEVYLATACVRQRELTQIASRNLKSLHQQLRESAVNADLNRILNMLQQERRRLRVQTETQQRALQAAEMRLQTARNAERRRRELREQLYKIEAEIATLSAQIEQDEPLLSRWRTLQAQQDRYERLRREADANQRHLDQLEQLERRVRTLETALQTDFADWTTLPSDFKEQVDAAYMRYQDAARRLHALSEEARRAQAARGQARGRTQARLGFAVLGVALLFASAPLWSVAPALGGVALALGLIALGVALFWRKRSDAAPTAAEPLLQQAQHEAQTHWRTLVSLLREAGYPVETPSHNGASGTYGVQAMLQLQQTVQEFSERWNALQAQRAELDATRRQIDALHAIHDPKALRERQRELAVEILGLQEQIQRDPLARKGLPAETLLRLESQLERARQQLSALREEQLRCEGALHNLPDAEPADAVELEYAQALQRLEQLQQRARLLETTEQLLSEANTRYLSDLSPRLKPRIEQYLPALTLGRYTHAELDDTLRLHVYHPERDATLPVEEGQPAWSASVLDQLFFACRLGLSDALSGDLRLPLLLDDPFVHFDAERHSAALELLTRVAQQTQVILFTCRALPDGAWGKIHRLS
ncbi:MAG: AAA family ATPase [Fimbriimonadales bacterium]|nr:AAA family ATPase [Fimbriimonadales bacterium]